MTRVNRDRCVAFGFEFCIVAILAILLNTPSSEFAPLLPSDFRYAFALMFAAGLLLLVVGCLARPDDTRS